MFTAYKPPPLQRLYSSMYSRDFVNFWGFHDEGGHSLLFFLFFFGTTDRSSLAPDITRSPLPSLPLILLSPGHRLITVQSMIVCIFNIFFLYFLFNLFFFLGLVIFRLEHI